MLDNVIAVGTGNMDSLGSRTANQISGTHNNDGTLLFQYTILNKYQNNMYKCSIFNI